jgi:hypothetical protein
VLKMSSSDKRKQETLSAKAELRNLTKVKKLLICVKSMVLDMLRYTVSGERERRLFCEKYQQRPQRQADSKIW